jgi:hypothetical protein
VPVETPEQEAIHAKGKVWNPHREQPKPWVCVRCGEMQTIPPYYRVDGRACEACYRAEEPPPLLTAEQIAERKAQKASRMQAADDRLEAAYAAKEQR